jgi:hypothetical protein
VRSGRRGARDAMLRPPARRVLGAQVTAVCFKNKDLQQHTRAVNSVAEAVHACQTQFVSGKRSMEHIRQPVLFWVPRVSAALSIRLFE